MRNLLQHTISFFSHSEPAAVPRRSVSRCVVFCVIFCPVTLFVFSSYWGERRITTKLQGATSIATSFLTTTQPNNNKKSDNNIFHDFDFTQNYLKK